MDRKEVLGKPVPHHHPGSQGQQVRLLGRILPRRGAALGHVGLIEEERNEGDIPRRPGLQAVQQVLVPISCERAPVIPGHAHCLLRTHKR